MSKLDLELEKSRKEKEDLAKELEKVENEAQAIQTRRRIQFIKSNSALASWPNLSIPTAILMPVSIPLVSMQEAPQIALTLSTTTNTQFPFTQSQQLQKIVLNEANIVSSSSVSIFQKKPIYIDKYR